MADLVTTPERRPILNFLQRFRDKRADRGRPTDRLDELLASGASGNGLLRGRVQGLLQNVGNPDFDREAFRANPSAETARFPGVFRFRQANPNALASAGMQMLSNYGSRSGTPFAGVGEAWVAGTGLDQQAARDRADMLPEPDRPIYSAANPHPTIAFTYDNGELWQQDHNDNWRDIRDAPFMTTESSYDQTTGTFWAERNAEIITGADTAYSTLGQLDLMEQLMNQPGFYGGLLSGAVETWNQLLGVFGHEPAQTAAAAQQAFRSISNELGLEMMGGSLGVGFSNEDRSYIRDIVPNLGFTEEANRVRIAILRAINERALEIEQMRSDYIARNERLDEGFNREMREWSRANHVFDEEVQARIRSILGTEGGEAVPEGGEAVPEGGEAVPEGPPPRPAAFTRDAYEAQLSRWTEAGQTVDAAIESLAEVYGVTPEVIRMWAAEVMR